MTVKNFLILIYLIIELDFVVKDNLEPIFNPKSIAIIGVSRDASALSYAYVHSVKQYGYKGKLYLVNPKSDSILGLKCYSSVLKIPHQIDLSIIWTKKELVPIVIQECVEKGVGDSSNYCWICRNRS